eukprot:gb/GEZN01002563.1/.p1 GENE.gb/GEZN01002563.1/~~gb/GEZN01002563.1/.p1  ORF type:complete len:742 (-),score=9.80 gb/GEZN01002563.1/:216-2108(-)
MGFEHRGLPHSDAMSFQNQGVPHSPSMNFRPPHSQPLLMTPLLKTECLDDDLQPVWDTQLNSSRRLQFEGNVKPDPDGSRDAAKSVTTQTCNCVNSRCSRKYCVCHKNGKKCSDKCNCRDCANRETVSGSTGSSSGSDDSFSRERSSLESPPLIDTVRRGGENPFSLQQQGTIMQEPHHTIPMDRNKSPFEDELETVHVSGSFLGLDEEHQTVPSLFPPLSPKSHGRLEGFPRDHGSLQGFPRDHGFLSSPLKLSSMDESVLTCHETLKFPPVGVLPVGNDPQRPANRHPLSTLRGATGGLVGLVSPDRAYQTKSEPFVSPSQLPRSQSDTSYRSMTSHFHHLHSALPHSHSSSSAVGHQLHRTPGQDFHSLRPPGQMDLNNIYMNNPSNPSSRACPMEDRPESPPITNPGAKRNVDRITVGGGVGFRHFKSPQRGSNINQDANRSLDGKEWADVDKYLVGSDDESLAESNTKQESSPNFSVKRRYVSRFKFVKSPPPQSVPMPGSIMNLFPSSLNVALDSCFDTLARELPQAHDNSHSFICLGWCRVVPGLKGSIHTISFCLVNEIDKPTIELPESNGGDFIRVPVNVQFFRALKRLYESGEKAAAAQVSIYTRDGQFYTAPFTYVMCS